MDVSAEEQSRVSDDERDTTAQVTASNDASRGAEDDDSAIITSTAGAESFSKNEHQFQKAIAAWRSIDFGNLVPQLDKAASDVIENQKEAVIHRKELAQKTKEFRKLDDDAKLTEYKTLLKSYQGFIDLLTNHQKTTSSAFLQLYSTVSEAPDPYPLLEASVDSLLVSEDVVPKINAENERLKRSVRGLTRDLELAETQLQQERSTRKQLEQSQETKAKDIEASWQAVLDERKDNWEAKERALEDKVENQERLFSEIKASFEVSQRLDQGSGGGDSNAYASASAAELDLVTSELEKTGLRLAEVESRNEQLRLELAQASSNAPARGNIEDDPAFARLRSENGSLLRKLDAARFEKDADAREWERRIRSLERDTQTLQQEREELRAKVSQWRDYPDLKRELEVFKAIEFSTGDDDDGGAATATDELSECRHGLKSNGTAPSNSSDTLEQLLLARNKKLGNEMAVLRVAHQDLQGELEELRESASITNADLERARNLNVTLENDLLTLQQEASNQFPSAKSTTSRYPASTYGRTRKSSPTSSIISGFDPHRGGFDSLGTGEPMGAGSGILPMVQAQRDRFKQKISQLESELSKQYNTVSSLRQEVASLQKDNLSLYEKTRYVSTYQRSQPQASSASAYSANPSSHVIQMSGDTSSGLSLDRYRSAYEANISPFAAFRGRESARAYKRMSMPERAIFSVTRLVLANRTSRNLFAAYCVALHLLVFVMLYWMQGADLEKHASNLGEAVVTAGLGGMTGAAERAGGGADATATTIAHHGEWHQEGIEGVAPG